MNTTLAIEIIFWASVVAVLLPFVGYPISLMILSAFRRRDTARGNGTPSVSLVVSAFNEAGVIGKKIENALSLDYPKDKLEIIVISDASDDGTDDIVQKFAGSGVKLRRQEDRGGKSAGLTRWVPEATGEIAVFSDANAMYQADAIRELVGHFDDPAIAYVVGNQKYVDDGLAASTSESMYMKHEAWIKLRESMLSSVVGGDGAIYAIRASLFESLRNDDISDFVNPLQIVVKGYRGVFEPRAICYESGAQSFGGEFGRKVRIVNRGFRGLLRVPQAMNPIRVGWFAYQLVFHKLLRWFVPLYLLVILVSNILLVMRTDTMLYRVTLAIQSVFLLAALMGLVPGIKQKRLFYLPHYFLVMNMAAALGILSFFVGLRFATWNPERTGGEVPAEPESGKSLMPGRAAAFFLLIALTVLTVSLAYMSYPGQHPTAYWVFWICFALLTYAYVGYSLILVILAGDHRLRPSSDAWQPAVSLIIPAHNEEKVIEDKLENALALDYPRDRLQILIASDGSTDRTNEIVRSYTDRGVELLAFDERRGKASALNDAIDAAEGNILCLCDANVMFQPQAIRVLADRLGDESVGAASGNVQLASEESNFEQGESLYYKIEKRLQENESNVGSMMGVDGGMYVINKKLFQPLPPDTILDDFVISMNVIRQGHRVVYEPAAIATENGTPLARQEYRRRVRVAAGAIQSLKRGQWPRLSQPVQAWQYFSHKVVRWLGPVLLFLLLFSSARLWSSGLIYQVALVSQIVFYSLALLGLVSVTLRATRLIGIAFYFTLSNVAMAVGYVKGLFGWQKVTWQQAERTSGRANTNSPVV